MALTATIYRVQVDVSDVDRGVYESLDLRLARHPSENMRYLLTRMLAYCLCYESGIQFSKGGLSTASEAPITVTDATGLLLHWIDVGSPSAERLHKATKAAQHVTLFSSTNLAQLQREASSRAIHRLEEIRVWLLQPAFLDSLDALMKRKTKVEVVRTEGQLYVTVGEQVVEGELTVATLDAS